MKTMIPIQFIMEMETIAPQRMRTRYGIQYASTFLEKFIGLMFKKDFQGELIFTYAKPSNFFIHTFFMRFPIDVVAYNEKSEVIKSVKLEPWRIVFIKGVKWFIEKKSA